MFIEQEGEDLTFYEIMNRVFIVIIVSSIFIIFFYVEVIKKVFGK